MAVVFAKVKWNQVLEGGRDMPSSMDTYDVEYGWTAEDFSNYAGGELVNIYTIDIAAATGSDFLTLRNRYTQARGHRLDTIVLHKDGERLYDIGPYGVYDTLQDKKLASFPCMEPFLKHYDGESVYFQDWHNSKELRKMNISTGTVDNAQDPGLPTLLDNMLKPSVFCVNGRPYTINNTRNNGWMAVRSSEILDEKGRVVWSENGHYAVSAVGFSEDLIRNIKS